MSQGFSWRKMFNTKKMTRLPRLAVFVVMNLLWTCSRDALQQIHYHDASKLYSVLFHPSIRYARLFCYFSWCCVSFMHVIRHLQGSRPIFCPHQLCFQFLYSENLLIFKWTFSPDNICPMAWWGHVTLDF